MNEIAKAVRNGAEIRIRVLIVDGMMTAEASDGYICETCEFPADESCTDSAVGLAVITACELFNRENEMQNNPADGGEGVRV